MMATYKEIYWGLENQGATCYMNSTIQSLFHIKQVYGYVLHLYCSLIIFYFYPLKFRDTILEIHMDTNSQTTLLALKEIFVDLMRQENVHPVKTDKFTKSFGWDEQDCLVERDPQV